MNIIGHIIEFILISLYYNLNKLFNYHSNTKLIYIFDKPKIHWNAITIVEKIGNEK